MGEGEKMARTIAVTGKGGTGKTVVSSLIIRHLKERSAGPVLALDADPDANLATVLGIPVEKTIGDLREESLKGIKNLPPGMDKANYLEAGLHEVIVETKKLDLITMGRSEGPGCYCYINNLLRKFADDLQSSYEWVVIDNEAGLEHLSRRTAAKVDHLIVVVNQNPLSIDCAKRIDKLTSDLKQGIREKHLLVNNAGNVDCVGAIRKKTGHLDMEFLGCVPHDSAVESFVFEGRSLFELDRSPAILKMDEVMEKIRSGKNEERE